MSEDPSWRRNCNLLTKSLLSLQKKITTIRRSTKKLITVEDINREREKIRETTRHANMEDVTAIHEAVRQMERFMQIHPCFSVEGVKLMGDAQKTLKDYQQSCDIFYNSCIAVEKKYSERQSLARAEQENSDMDKEAGESSSLLMHGTQQTQRLRYEQLLHDEIVQELERETREIAENVRDVNIIFNHITKLVMDQGVQIDQIDQSLETTVQATRSGNEQLRRAADHAKKSNSWKWLIIALIILMLIVCLHLIAK